MGGGDQVVAGREAPERDPVPPAEALGRDTTDYVEKFDTSLARSRAAVAGKPAPSVLFVFGRDAATVANVDAAGPGSFVSQPLCLGARIPRGLPLREILLMTFTALVLQEIQLDELDAAGVMNVRAAKFWQQNPQRIPLSRETFLGDPS